MEYFDFFVFSIYFIFAPVFIGLKNKLPDQDKEVYNSR